MSTVKIVGKGSVLLFLTFLFDKQRELFWGLQIMISHKLI